MQGRGHLVHSNDLLRAGRLPLAPRVSLGPLRILGPLGSLHPHNLPSQSLKFSRKKCSGLEREGNGDLWALAEDWFYLEFCNHLKAKEKGPKHITRTRETDFF